MASILNSYSILPYFWKDISGTQEMVLIVISYLISIFFFVFAFFISLCFICEDGAQSTIFILFPSFSYYLLSLSIVILQNFYARNTNVDFWLILLHRYPTY